MSAQKITAERLRELLHYNPDTGVFTRRTDNKRGCLIGDVAGSVHGRTGYVQLYIDGFTHTAARLAWLYMTGHHPSHDMDHINGQTADNRWCNLRDVPTQINSQNTLRLNGNNKSGVIGAQFRADRGKWVAVLRINGKSRRFGAFETAEEASAAYLEAKRLHHPGFTG